MFYNLRRRTHKAVNRTFYRVGPETLVAALRAVGLERGSVVCVHSALSRLGHIEGGADAVIDALMAVVGEEGTILMPSFPTGGSTADFLDQGGIFDVRNSPSVMGLITEVFRRRPGILRSLHPTNPLAGWGARAEEILRDHEKSLTPYGPDTPYGRLAEIENSVLLMMETHVHSLLHHLQQRVDFPNLYLPEMRRGTTIDWDGVEHRVPTRAMRPRVIYYVAVPPVGGGRGDAPDWAILHDYALMFPKTRRREAHRLGFRFDGYPVLYRRRAEFEQAGILRAARVGRGEIGLLRIGPFLARMEPEMREIIARYRDHYDPERIAAMGMPYT